MNKINDAIYFDKIRWLYLNLEQLNLNSQEINVIVSIIILSELNKEITVDEIAKLLNLKVIDVDNTISLLAAKNYLQIKVINNVVAFDISNVFELKEAVNYEVKDIFIIFEEEFSRLLTQNELQTLNKWVKEYSKDQIVEALRNAAIMRKLDFRYINRILENSSNE